MAPSDNPVVGQVLTYRQATRRALAATLAAAAGGFVVIAATRVQLAADLTTPLAFDLIVWATMVTVAGVAVIGAGVCVWMRAADQIAVRRRRARDDDQADLETMPLPRPLPVRRPAMTSGTPVPAAVMGRHHRAEVIR